MQREDFEKEYAETIRMIQRRFQVLVQQSSDVSEIISSEGIIQYISPAVEKITGCKPEDRIGKNAREFFKEKEKIKFQQMIDYVLENPDKRIEGDMVLTTGEGKEIHLSLRMDNYLEEPSINGIVINWRDITERVEKEKEIQYVATHDELSNLPNQMYLRKKMMEICQQSEKEDCAFALIMLNIDGFKYINDALGHQLGDQLITSVARRLKANITKGMFLCRYSGDQFAILLKGKKSIDEYEEVVNEIRGFFNIPFKVDMFELDITVSCGISICPDDEQDIDQLINYANIALLRAKQGGKSKYQFYSSDVGIETYKQLILRNDLIKAIEKNQMKVHYQPIVDIDTCEVLAIEALMRWEHPDCGMVSPMEFIPIAEETGFIISLGNWMLKEVCKDYRMWQTKKMAPIRISVNYSSIQFFERDFVENIMDTIRSFDLDPRFLIMEITENIFMKNADSAIHDIKKLQSNGISVALDDFGTGYSSLSYLNTFDLDILKIDRSFVKNALSDKASDIITRAVIDLAVALNIKLVAEGIENWEQLSYLKSLGCRAGQGYLFKKPMPFNELMKLLMGCNCIRPQIDKDNVCPLGKRRQRRIILPETIDAEIIVTSQENQESIKERGRVAIKNISADGICFSTDKKIEVNQDNVIQIDIARLTAGNKLKGHTVWRNEVGNSTYEYGVKMNFNREEKVRIIHALYGLCKSQYV